MPESVVIQEDNTHALKPSVAPPRNIRGGVKRLLTFFVLLVVIFYAADLAISTGLRGIKTSQFGVMNQIVDGQLNAEILITGSSRAFTHYDPRIIRQVTGRSAFNIGLNGSQTDMQLALLKTYLKHNKKPDLVIHNLDSFAFVTTHGGVYDPGQYLPYLKERDIYDALYRIDPKIWKSRYLPLYGYAVEDLRFTWMLGIGNLVGAAPEETLFFGFQPRHMQWTGEFEKYRAVNVDGVVIDIETAGIEAFTDLIKVCRDEGVPVLMVYSPVYHEMTTLERNKDVIWEHFKEIGERFHAQTWDYRNSSISQTKDYFYNSHHLNAQGAALFSTDLSSRLLREFFVDRSNAVDGPSEPPVGTADTVPEGGQ
jgi:hypothetical protein